VRKNSKGFAPIVVLVLIIIVGIVAYYFGTQKKKPALLITPTPVLTTVPATNTIANWKTYTNTKYGYSIMYPQTWNIKSSGDPTGDGRCHDINTSPDLIEISSEPMTNCIGIMDNREIMIQVVDTPWSDDYLNDKFSGILDKIEFAGQTASRFIFDDTAQQPSPLATKIVFNYRGLGYRIFVVQKQGGIIYDKSFDQILSTFKFTN